MKFLLIGHYAVDVFHLTRGRTDERPGGILNSAVALAGIVGEKDRIVPVCGVHEGDYDALIERLAAFPVIDSSGVFKTPSATNCVEYYPQEGGTVAACPKVIAPPIPFERIRPFLGVGGVLVNMVSGEDITLETLDQIRMAVRSDAIPLHLDLHNLTLGVNEKQERYRRPVEQWRRWAFMIDTIQCNEAEIAGLTVERLPENRTAGHLLTLGVKGVVVTRGGNGASLYCNEHKNLVRKDFPTTNGIRATVTVGAGDAFGAAFHHCFVTAHDLAAATEAGLHAGSAFLAGRETA